MEGILYGVGVGPGDPELMTLQAVRVIRECDLILAPGKEPRETVAWQIAAGAVPELEEKEAVGIHMPMTKDPDTLKKAHGEAAERIIQELAKGRRAAFLTLGDPCIYSTYLYVHKKVRSAGCRAEIISGIPSFIAASAAVGEERPDAPPDPGLLPVRGGGRASRHKGDDEGGKGCRQSAG